ARGVASTAGPFVCKLAYTDNLRQSHSTQYFVRVSRRLAENGCFSRLFGWFNAGKDLHCRRFSPPEVLRPLLPSHRAEEFQFDVRAQVKCTHVGPSRRAAIRRVPQGRTHAPFAGKAQGTGREAGQSQEETS